METFSTSLFAELELQLQALDFPTDDRISHAQTATKLLLAGLERLPEFTRQYRFANKDEEVHFFRDVKPRIVSQLIFHNEIYRICTTLPCDSTKGLRKF